MGAPSPLSSRVRVCVRKAPARAASKGVENEHRQVARHRGGALAPAKNGSRFRCLDRSCVGRCCGPAGTGSAAALQWGVNGVRTPWYKHLREARQMWARWYCSMGMAVRFPTQSRLLSPSAAMQALSPHPARSFRISINLPSPLSISLLYLLGSYH